MLPVHTKTSIGSAKGLAVERIRTSLNAASEEFRKKFPRLIANIVIALLFAGTSQIVGWIFNGFNYEIVFLLQIGLLLAAGMFLVRTLFDALVVTDKATKLLLKRVGIKKELSNQRIFKDIVYIVAVLLIAAAIVPIVTQLSTIGQLLQQIITFAATGILLVFVYDIARTFYKITEKKANGLADRFSSPTKGDETNAK